MTLNVAVVFGGRSVEHEISIISAQQCINAFAKSKYQVVPIYISKEGQWYSGDDFLKIENFRNLEKLLVENQKIIINQNAGITNFYREPRNIFSRRKPFNIDIAFPVMHGTYGEDGSLQGLFEMMNIPYVGCDVLSSAVAMDKITTKMVLQAQGIKVLDYFWFYSEKWFSARETVIAGIKNKFNYPLIVKPSNLGSSIGVTAVNNDAELEDAVDLVIRLSHRVLIEPKVRNLKEINCAVLGDHDFVEVSVCEEPIRSDAILSYQDKYAGGTKSKFGAGGVKTANGGMSSAKRKIPADISSSLGAKIQEISRQVFLNLNCNGVVRIDFLIDQDANEIFVCEINTIPGSLAFYLWEPLGKSFTVLTERLIELALKRHRENNNLIVSYSENILGRWDLK
jgi:D-alanine-D-alanine ligase